MKLVPRKSSTPPPHPSRSSSRIQSDYLCCKADRTLQWTSTAIGATDSLQLDELLQLPLVWHDSLPLFFSLKRIHCHFRLAQLRHTESHRRTITNHMSRSLVVKLPAPIPGHAMNDALVADSTLTNCAWASQLSFNINVYVTMGRMVTLVLQFCFRSSDFERLCILAARHDVALRCVRVWFPRTGRALQRYLGLGLGYATSLLLSFFEVVGSSRW